MLILGYDFLSFVSPLVSGGFLVLGRRTSAEALSRKSSEELHAKDLGAYRNLILIEKTIHI